MSLSSFPRPALITELFLILKARILSSWESDTERKFTRSSKKIMDDFKVSYDEEEDILYLAKEGEEAEVVEVSPGVNMELDSNGNLIGVELFKASRMFKNVLKSMEKKLQVA